MSKITRSRRRREPVTTPTEAPAYWVKNKQMASIERYAVDGSNELIAELIRKDAKAVPREDGDGIETTLVGELLNLLANAGVPLPRGNPSGYGILIALDPSESAVVREGIDNFMENAGDDTLSGDPALVLYSEEPDLVRRGIEYLKKALRIPSGYDALLLLAR